MEIDVLFENNDVVVINKPVGVLVHPDGHAKEDTVVDWFVEQYPDAKEVGEPQTLTNGDVIDRPGVVHRLDRETSGVMILAKTDEAFTHLKKQFHDRRTRKEYRAFVYGSMKELHGTIERPIGRSVKDFRLRSAERGARGTLRKAITDWELLTQNAGYAYLRVLPKTGRTHQIRVHLKAIGRPIVGDALYANQAQLDSPDLGLGRLALHAYKLTIELPNGEEHTFTAPLPQSFETAKERIAVA
ncbi:RluA family pseudouridine synthase [Candidatus Kaiserbacteria bacterium]|nr:RluA family pseudouridine synthase [Candidatus Kaiserbacteria bacterium]